MIKVSLIFYNYSSFRQGLDGLVAPRRNNFYINIFKYSTLLIIYWIGLNCKISLGNIIIYNLKQLSFSIRNMDIYLELIHKCEKI